MAYQKKLVYFVAAYCLIGISVFGAPHPKTVVNAGDNDVVLDTSVHVEASAGVGTENQAPAAPHSPGHGVRKPGPLAGPNLYNDIFNIPTSILGAVSRLLSNGGSSVGNAFASVGTSGGAGAGAGAGVHPGHKSGVGAAGAVVSIGGGDGGGLGSRFGGGNDGGVSAGAGFGSFGVGASAGVGTGGARAGAGVGGRPGGQGFFNDIFNIPITALNAVNQLLNNNQKTSG